MSDVIYNSFKLNLLKGNIDFENDTIKVALVTSSYTPNKDSHDNFNDITNEVSGTGYTAGGEILSNVSLTKDDTNDLAYLDADNIVWSSSTITARGAVIYKEGNSGEDCPLIAYLDFNEDKIATDDDFTLNFSDDGILKIQETS